MFDGDLGLVADIGEFIVRFLSMFPLGVDGLINLSILAAT
jgi:hypothetical protein